LATFTLLAILTPAGTNPYSEALLAPLQPSTVSMKDNLCNKIGKSIFRSNTHRVGFPLIKNRQTKVLKLA
jgi:hypothetical protein